ncbi:MAG: thiamine phosphate synthase [Pseudomonadota bacterium]
MTDAPPERLYLVTAQSLEPEVFAPTLAAALAALPVACVRLDLGGAEEDMWRRAANHLIEPCHAADVALIITDHYRLVEPLGLDGVHLTGRASVRDVRKALGRDRIVGAFAGSSRHDGMVLAEAGADYVAFGPVGETGALGDETRAEDDLFTWWAEMIETQSVAEGGVSPEDAARLADAADFIVPDRRVWDGDDPVAALTAYAAALS